MAQKRRRGSRTAKDAEEEEIRGGRKKHVTCACVQKNKRERKDEKWRTKGEKRSDQRRTKAEESEEWKSVDNRRRGERESEKRRMR